MLFKFYSAMTKILTVKLTNTNLGQQKKDVGTNEIQSLLL